LEIARKKIALRSGVKYRYSINIIRHKSTVFFAGRVTAIKVAPTNAVSYVSVCIHQFCRNIKLGYKKYRIEKKEPTKILTNIKFDISADGFFFQLTLSLTVVIIFDK